MDDFLAVAARYNGIQDFRCHPVFIIPSCFPHRLFLYCHLDCSSLFSVVLFFILRLFYSLKFADWMDSYLPAFLFRCTLLSVICFTRLFFLLCFVKYLSSWSCLVFPSAFGNVSGFVLCGSLSDNSELTESHPENLRTIHDRRKADRSPLRLLHGSVSLATRMNSGVVEI